MIMTKRAIIFLSLILAVVMMASLFLVACGKDPEESSSETKAETTEKKHETTLGETDDSTKEETTSLKSETDETVGESDETAESDNTTETSADETLSETLSETDSETLSDTEVETKSETVVDETTEVDTEATTESVETETEDPRLSAEYAPELYFSAKDIYNVAKPGEFDAIVGFRRVGMVMMDNDKTYTRLYAMASGASDANFPLLSSRADGARYLVIKYRTTIPGFSIEFFLDSENSEAVAGSSTGMYAVNADGYWNFTVIDLSKIKSYDGKRVNYIRFDFVNAKIIPENAYIDVAYIGLFNSPEDADKFEYGEDYTAPSFNAGDDYKLTDLVHASALDYVNGTLVSGQGMGANSNKGAEIYTNRVWTTNGTDENGDPTYTVTISGWTVVEGGFSKIVWSADGGKTWHDATLFAAGYGNGSQAHLDAVDARLGVTDAINDDTNSVKGCCYQGIKGVGAVLGKEYYGKEITLQFAAVPNLAPDTLCPLILMTKIDVGAVLSVGGPVEEETIEIPVTDFEDSVINAGDLSNEVNAYFPMPDRSELVVENKDFIYSLELEPNGQQVINSITGKNTGAIFLEKTSDAFVIDAQGRKYYAGKTSGGGNTNIYRQGYYFFDVHVYGADFVGGVSEYDATKSMKYSNFSKNDIELISQSGNEIVYKVIGSDPRIYFNTKALSSTYQFISITLKSTESTSGQLYYATVSMDGFSSERCSNFKILNDGEFHTYLVPISGLGIVNENIDRVRVDIGTNIGEEITIKDIEMVSIEDMPTLRFDRTLYVYSDKVNQVMHLIAPTVNRVQAYGWETVVPANTVSKLIVGDKNGTHTSLDDVDWDSAKYVGFDIKNVGVLGYILVDDASSGKLNVTLEDGKYVITQTVNPEKNRIDAGSDIYMGHRLYTKETHDFQDFLFEAYCEYNPLQQITVYGSGMTSRYFGYDALRGAYKYQFLGAAWNNVYLNAQNKHMNVFGNIKGDEKDRQIYVYTANFGNVGTLECAVMLDGNGNIIPIPLEVCNNFNGDGEANEFLNDAGYSEVIFPLIIKAGSENAFQIAHLYQNWGRYPLKQIHSIQFYAPFYHLSTGVTETNCIRPWYDMNAKLSLYILPDHRAMSATLWMDIYEQSNGTILSNQPQHTNGGNHQFLQYTDEDGEIVYSENIQNYIGSYGPTYAEIDMVFLSDDGRIKVTYKHLEMPQTDENRTYYEIKYEILEDVKIGNVLREFAFYSVAGRNMNYEHLGYLDENNQHVIIDTNKNEDGTTDESAERIHVLGDEAPYFSLFEYREKHGTPDLDDYENNYVNLGCIVFNSDIKVNGEKYDGGFALYENGRRTCLTLNIDGEATFKKGDTMTLNLILMPWGDGYGKTDYESEYPNINVIKVRENSALNPFVVTAGENCRVVDSVFLPRVETTNGKSAEFTISGGENNVTVRAYGFKKATRPTIYELVGGEWVVYEVSSANTPDSQGNAHDYDGYMVQYDGDGNYSYSFVTTMTNGAPRTFKIVVE